MLAVVAGKAKEVSLWGATTEVDTENVQIPGSPWDRWTNKLSTQVAEIFQTIHPVKPARSLALMGHAVTLSFTEFVVYGRLLLPYTSYKGILPTLLLVIHMYIARLNRGQHLQIM